MMSCCLSRFDLGFVVTAFASGLLSLVLKTMLGLLDVNICKPIGIVGLNPNPRY